MHFSRAIARLLSFVVLSAAGLWALLGAHAAHAQDTWFVDDSVSDGLVAYWRFDEPTVPTAIETVNLRHATLEVGAVQANGPIPAGLEFTDMGVLRIDGLDDLVSVADDPLFNALTSSLTVAGWVQRDRLNGGIDTIYVNGSLANAWHLAIMTDHRLAFRIGTAASTTYSSTVASAALLNNLDYHHVAVTVTGGQVRLYIDGVLNATHNGVVLPNPTSGTKYIGSQSDSAARFPGLIDDLRIYSRALTAAEVARLAQGAQCPTDGTTWDTAFRDLQCGLSAATSGDQIWIGEGIYKPGSNLFQSFVLKNGVTLFGGFLGLTANTKETALSQRPAFNAASPLVTLTGDLFGNDGPAAFEDYGENTTRVVVATANTAATMDTLRIRGGSATRAAPFHAGGGLRIFGNANVTLNSVVFLGNRASTDGGAVASISPLQVSASHFISNRAEQDGGAIAITGTLQVAGTVFTGNFAREGGAVAARGPAKVQGSLFSLQQMTSSLDFGKGGAIHTTATMVITNTNFLSNTHEGGNGGAIFASAPITISGGLFQNNRSRLGGLGQGGAVSAENSLTVNNVEFRANRAGGFGGALSISTAGTLNVRFSTFAGNQSGTFGGAIDAGRPTRIEFSTFDANQSSAAGGAIDATFGGGDLIINGSDFTGNKAIGQNCDIPPAGCSGGSGGAISASPNLSVTATTFQDNRAVSNGGAIHLGDGAMVIDDSSFVSNNAAVDADPDTSGSGGAIFGEGTLAISNSTIRQNQAESAGGAIAFTGTVGIRTSSVTTNTAPTGGGIHQFGALSITNSAISGNSATISGGGIFASDLITLTTVTMNGNSSAAGGAIQASALIDNTVSPTFVISNSTFANNSATVTDGGAIGGDSIFSITASSFFTNSAARDGGGLFFTNGPTLLTDNLFQGNQAARFGGAARLNGATVSADRYIGNVAGNEGGALVSFRDLTIRQAHLVGNQASLSGAIAVDGPNAPAPRLVLVIENSLFAGNIVTQFGGGTDMRIFDAELALNHGTFADPQTTGPRNAIVAFRSLINARNDILAGYATNFVLGDGSTLDEDFNLYLPAAPPPGPGVTLGANSLVGDPLFANAAARDYHLTAASPALNAGTDRGVTLDFEGDARPIGGAFDIGFDEARFAAPTAAAGGPYSGNEGAAIPLNASGSSDNVGIVTFAWDCTDNGSFDFSASQPTGVSCTYADNGAFTLRLRVTDGDGLSATQSAPVTINNVTPALTAPLAQSLLVSTTQDFALGSFADPGPDAPWQVTVNWGDGSGDTEFAVSAVGALPPKPHQFTSVGGKIVTVSVRDKDGATGTVTFTVNVLPEAGDASYLPLVQN